MAAASVAKLQWTGIKAPLSLKVGEPYRQLLHKAYRKLMTELSNLESELALALSTKAMNSTSGLGGLFPSALVFDEYLRVYPRFELPSKRATLCSRAQTADKARN